MAARAMTDEFQTKEITVRGTTYKFRELSANDYEEIIKMAQGEDGQAELGPVLRMMTAQSLIEPKLGEKVSALPLPVYNKLVSIVNQMHFQDEEEQKEGESPNS